MIFNSCAFIFVCLPIALFGYFAADRVGPAAPVVWLAPALMAFYSLIQLPIGALLPTPIAFDYSSAGR